LGSPENGGGSKPTSGPGNRKTPCRPPHQSWKPCPASKAGLEI